MKKVILGLFLILTLVIGSYVFFKKDKLPLKISKQISVDLINESKRDFKTIFQ